MKSDHRPSAGPLHLPAGVSTEPRHRFKRTTREPQMDYVKPAEVAKAMIEASRTKLSLSPRDLLIRGALSGALLGTATSFAFTGVVTTGQKRQ
jgi:hypothetical protein